MDREKVQAMFEDRVPTIDLPKTNEANPRPVPIGDGSRKKLSGKKKSIAA